MVLFSPAAGAPCSNRSISPARRTLGSKPAACCGTDKRTGRTDARPFHRLCSACRQCQQHGAGRTDQLKARSHLNWTDSSQLRTCSVVVQFSSVFVAVMWTGLYCEGLRVPMSHQLDAPRHCTEHSRSRDEFDAHVDDLCDYWQPNGIVMLIRCSVSVGEIDVGYLWTCYSEN